jgi:hypothetical protein
MSEIDSILSIIVFYQFLEQILLLDCTLVIFGTRGMLLALLKCRSCNCDMMKAHASAQELRILQLPLFPALVLALCC